MTWQLAALQATVLVHGRSPERVDAAVAEIAAATGSRKLVPYVADLASLAAVDKLADEVEARGGRLDALVDNAGVGMPARAESADGYEMTFAVNYLATFLLTELLFASSHRRAEPVGRSPGGVERGARPSSPTGLSTGAEHRFASA